MFAFVADVFGALLFLCLFFPVLFDGSLGCGGGNGGGGGETVRGEAH